MFRITDSEKKKAWLCVYILMTTIKTPEFQNSQVPFVNAKSQAMKKKKVC